MSDKALFDQHKTISLREADDGGLLLKPGDLVGGAYRLKELIGQGGMGYVFRAEHTIIKHDYALKIMVPEQINEVSWRRFESEGRAIAGLHHPNIVKVYNMGVDVGDCPFYVMDLLQGRSMAEEIMSGQAYDLHQILDILMQTASGLGYAHNKGIVHRDVKPSNIMLVHGPQGELSVRLVDFGLAKLVMDEHTIDQRLTSTGEVFGTPFYMSPEQCLGKGVDGRSDIYSLGCALFEMIEGVPPFIGTTALETVLMHINEPVPKFCEVFGDFKTERRINLLLSRMLAKRKEDRYQTMAQMVHDLERIRDEKEVGRQSLPAPSLRKIWQNWSVGRVKGASADKEQDVVDTPWPKKRLITFAVASVFALVGLGAYAIVQHSAAGKSQDLVQSQPGKSPETDAIGGDFVWPDVIADSGIQYRSQIVLSDHRLREATEKLNAVKEINTSTVAGVKTIHFPSYPLGTLLVNYKSAGLAEGDRCVSAAASLGLIVDWLEDPCTISNVSVFEKLDKSLFATLHLTGLGVVVQDARRQEADIQVPALLKILKLAAKWTNLRQLVIGRFHDIYGDDRVLAAIDDLPLLESLSAPTKELDMKQLSQHKFLKRLHRLDVDSAPHIDDLLRALAGSQELNALLIDRTNPSAEALLALRTSPNLTELSLQGCELSQAKFEALSKLPALQEIWLRGFHPTKEDLMILARSTSLSKVYLLESGPTPQEKAYWPNLLHCVEFREDFRDDLDEDF